MLATACILRPKVSRSANLWMKRLGSMGLLMSGCCSSRSSLHSCKNTAPRTYTLVCTTSEKSMSMYGLDSCRQMM